MRETLGALALAAAWVVGCGARTQAADAGSPAEVPIKYQASCTAFSPCGGDVEGSWTYADGCVEDPFPALKVFCPAATYDSLAVSANGVLTFEAGKATRNVTLSGTGVLKMPASCAGGSCAAVAASLTAVGVAATCTATGSAGDCRCPFSTKQVIDEATPYTVSGNSLTTNGRTYEYCVQEGVLGHHETSTTPKEPGTYLLNRN